MKTHLKRLSVLCVAACALFLTGCVSLDKLDAKMPLIDAAEITVTGKTPFVTARIHAKDLVNTAEEKTASEYNASLDTPWGSVSYDAKDYRRKKRAAAGAPR